VSCRKSKVDIFAGTFLKREGPAHAPFSGYSLVLIGVLTSTARGQNSAIEPIHAAAGTVLTFYLQTRLNPTGGEALDILPEELFCE